MVATQTYGGQCRTVHCRWIVKYMMMMILLLIIITIILLFMITEPNDTASFCQIQTALQAAAFVQGHTDHDDVHDDVVTLPSQYDHIDVNYK